MHGVSAAECAVRMARAGADIGRCHPVAFRQSYYTCTLDSFMWTKHMLASHNRVLRGQQENGIECLSQHSGPINSPHISRDPTDLSLGLPNYN